MTQEFVISKIQVPKSVLRGIHADAELVYQGMEHNAAPLNTLTQYVRDNAVSIAYDIITGSSHYDNTELEGLSRIRSACEAYSVIMSD
jgi:DhnA family fructose-bisphosphate aldolase class Ia